VAAFPRAPCSSQNFYFGPDAARPSRKTGSKRACWYVIPTAGRCTARATMEGRTQRRRLDGGQSNRRHSFIGNRELQRQSWTTRAEQDCMTCHRPMPEANRSVKRWQRTGPYYFWFKLSGVSRQQVRTWKHLGLFETALRDEGLSSLAKLASAAETSRTLEDSARSIIDANCCRDTATGGTVANFDAPHDTPLTRQALIDGPVLTIKASDHPRSIAAH